VPQRPPYHVSLVRWEEAQEALRAVRETVFVAEQGVPPELELDDEDPHCLHVLARDQAGRPIGTGRMTDDGHIGRVAVLAPWRGRGVGVALMQALLAEAARRGLERVWLNAQLSALAFYERLGFAAEGEVFMDAGIPHRRMRRRIGAA